jgi:hypothetical protein
VSFVNTLLGVELLQKQLVKVMAENICPSSVRNSSVCEGTAHQMADPVFAGLRNSLFDPDYFCEHHVPICSHPTYTRELAKDWVDDILTKKPFDNADYINDLYS